MTINEITGKVYAHAEKIRVYDCEFCRSYGKVSWNMDDQKAEAVVKMIAPCPDCLGTGQTPVKNIIAKLREEIDELEEAIEGNMNADKMAITMFNDNGINIDHKAFFKNEIKDTIGDELADIIITTLAGSKKLGVDIESHIVAKMRYNEIRKDHARSDKK